MDAKNVNVVELELSKTNAALAQQAAELLKKPVEEVISLCLKGSTNP